MHTRGNADTTWVAQATRYRYSLPVLAELERNMGCKFITLVRRLDASDRAVRQALDHLLAIGWVKRNPGYGHPSRPEYIVNENAFGIAERCRAVWDELTKWGQGDIALDRWPLSVLFVLSGNRSRYATLSKMLPGITPRSLSMALRALIEAGLATRDVLPGNPPRTEYRTTPWGQVLAGL